MTPQLSDAAPAAAAGDPGVGWRLSAAELVVLSDVVTSHVGYPEIDNWWAGLDEARRRALYQRGLEALGVRGEDQALRNAFRVRHDAVGVMLIEPNAGEVVAANVGADEQVVLERVGQDRGLQLLQLDLDEAVEVVISALEAGLGGTITALPLPQPAPVSEVRVVPADGGWTWASAGFEIALTPAEMTGALTLLAQTLASPEAATKGPSSGDR